MSSIMSDVLERSELLDVGRFMKRDGWRGGYSF